MVDSIDAFLRALREVAPGAKAQIDAPTDPKGETLLDVSDGTFNTEVSYRPDAGFGIFISDSKYGQRPDEIYRSASKAAQRIVQLKESWEHAGLTTYLTLAQIRQLMDLTQEKVAEALASRDAAATWGKGSHGESWLADYIAKKVGNSVIALHDRIIPGRKSNIDHLWVASTGIWVVDAKAYAGDVVQREVGPIWRRENKLYIGGKNRTKLGASVMRQVEAVAAARDIDESLRGTDIYAALCLIDSEWALLAAPFQIGRVWVMSPHALRKRLKKSGSLSRETMERIARRLDLSLPPAH